VHPPRAHSHNKYIRRKIKINVVVRTALCTSLQLTNPGLDLRPDAHQRRRGCTRGGWLRCDCGFNVRYRRDATGVAVASTKACLTLSRSRPLLVLWRRLLPPLARRARKLLLGQQRTLLSYTHNETRSGGCRLRLSPLRTQHKNTPLRLQARVHLPARMGV